MVEAGADKAVHIIPSTMESDDGRAHKDTRKGTKLSPICVDADMKRAATPSGDLRKLCFPENFSLIEAQLEVVPGVTSASFASNSASTADSKHNLYSWPEGDTDTILRKLMEKSITINRTVVDRTISRHGRSTQRWLTDSTTSKVSRLVTGCVPILSGGKIMLVSASKKNEWILPKGGWEMDEEMEESAIRETFEEAGVLGVIGPKLSEIEYETRKARERRLALEEKSKKNPESQGRFSSGWSDVSQLSEDDHVATDKLQDQTANDKEQALKALASNPSRKGENGAVTEHPDVIADSDINGTKDAKAITKDQVPAEPTMVHSHVCVSLFPLYVTDVMSTWPESGRLRKAAGIDEAIQLLAARPEMQSALIEVKKRSFHNPENLPLI